jgi:hypothetical protein
MITIPFVSNNPRVNALELILSRGIVGNVHLGELLGRDHHLLEQFL